MKGHSWDTLSLSDIRTRHLPNMSQELSRVNFLVQLRSNVVHMPTKMTVMRTEECCDFFIRDKLKVPRVPKHHVVMYIRGCRDKRFDPFYILAQDTGD